MLQWATGFIEKAGYGGILFLMVLENVFPPIPSEVILPFAGFTASQGRLSLAGVIIAGCLGSIIGALPLYYLGYFLGIDKVRRLAQRYGRWVAVSERDVDNAMQWFREYGPSIVLMGRLIPGVRSLISIPAGICGMTLMRFLLYSAVGTGLWSALLVYLGWLLGKNYEKVSQYVGYVSYAVAGLAIAGVIGWVLRKRKLDVG
jgi:membrane protein DedA with SNARE-associated domain